MTQPSQEWMHPERIVGRRVLLYEQLDSTNRLAAVLARDPSNDGLVVMAREQTAGRGQYGRSWVCPPDAGVLLSAVLFPPPHLRRPVFLTALAALAVCRCVEGFGAGAVRIKWPNDVLVGGLKICGILIEQAHGTVIGIGLNVSQPQSTLAEARLPLATSLLHATGQRLARAEVADRLLGDLDCVYQAMCTGELSGLETEWQQRFDLLGASVHVETAGGSFRGRLDRLQWDGVRLLLDSGDCVLLEPERVRHVFREE